MIMQFAVICIIETDKYSTAFGSSYRSGQILELKYALWYKYKVLLQTI